jgi:hypothetical protein
MAQRYQLGVRTSNVTSGQALLEIIAASAVNGGRGVRLLNFNITLATGVTGVFGTGRPAAAGITPTTPVTFNSDENDTPSLTKVALAWATSPTAPTSFFHRITVPATVGAVRDILPISGLPVGGGIWIPAGGTFTLHNITGGPTLDISMDILE